VRLQQEAEAKIIVASEDDPNRQLLETKISKDDGYQKQQGTHMVFTRVWGV
jgi:protein phosphatase-4 regulatory subunit 3